MMSTFQLLIWEGSFDIYRNTTWYIPITTNWQVTEDEAEFEDRVVMTDEEGRTRYCMYSFILHSYP